MYESFFGLRERPFDLTTNPRFLFLTPRHREALTLVEYALSARKGVSLLLGDAGTGKSTIVRAALQRQPEGSCIAYLTNPTLTRQDFYGFLASVFGLSAAVNGSKVRLLMQLEALLVERAAAGLLSALLIDEAQSLPHALLEEVRLLSNMETPTMKLLPVVLIGQPELAGRLNDDSLRQLKQRVSLRCSLQPLDLRETAAYITTRIRVAGGDSGQVFSREAVMAVYERSRGIPRTISVICDSALISGFAADQRPVGKEIVLEVCRDLDFPGGARAASAPAAVAAGESRPTTELFAHFTTRRRFTFF
ncbi:MAG: AAA family ATPase [Acidobacteria bacterium]|nr:AAA family ATPase [Acidobacteriota bacterium]